jgi:urea carboxylase system permease
MTTLSTTPVAASDSDDLAKFGYKQELDRSLGKFSSFAAGFSYLSILTGVFQLFGFGFLSGGPAFWWSWPIVFVGQLLVALCFAEMAGQFPLAGSVYQWSKQVARPVTSWMAGWVILIGSVVTVAAVAVAYQVILPQISTKFEIVGSDADAGLYTTPGGAKNAVVLALLLVIFTTVINMIGVKLMARINNVGVMVELIGSTILVVILAFHITRGPGVVLHTVGTGTGHSSGYLGAILIASLVSTYIFYGFDTAGSLAEETSNPRKFAPVGIIRAVCTAALIGGVLMLVAMMAMPNIFNTKVITQIGTLGLPYVLKTVLGNPLGDVFLVCSAIAITVCALAVHTAGIRIMFTMARDGRLPFGSAVARVSGKSKTPIIPALVIGALTVLLLVVNIGNQRVFYVLTSVAIIMFYIAYMCVTGPLLLKRIRGEWPRSDHGPYFNLGRFGTPINVIAVIFQTIVVVNLAWPRAAVYGSDHWYFQWGAFVFIGIVVAVGALYYFTTQHGRGNRVLAEHRAAAFEAPASADLVD